MPDAKPDRPLGIKNYGSIGHLPGSRMGQGDHKCSDGQRRIATERARDKHEIVIVQEKLDGSNVGVARVDGEIFPLTRSGYLAYASRYEQHRHFGRWALLNRDRFLAVLKDGERLVGEWLMQAHGTRYALPHEPFVAFDLMVNMDRMIYDQFKERTAAGNFVTPHVIHRGGPLPIEQAIKLLGPRGHHGSLDLVEGAVWRIERNELTDSNSGVRQWRVDFLTKYVRPDKVDGCYLPEVSGRDAVFNWTG